MRRTTFAAMLVLLFAAVPAGAAPQAPHKETTSDFPKGASPLELETVVITKNIPQFSVLWAKDWSAKNLDAVMALYDTDAEFMPGFDTELGRQGGDPEKFRERARAIFRRSHLHSQRSDASGDLAYDSGVYDEKITSVKDDKVIQVRGNYLFVFRRQKTANGKSSNKPGRNLARGNSRGFSCALLYPPVYGPPSQSS